MKHYLAPIIVFKHATKAVNDVYLACELHQVSVDVSPALAANLERELVSGFAREGKLWEYLSVSKVEAVLNKNEKRKQKSMKRGGSAEGFSKMLRVSCKAMGSCVGILEEVAAIDATGNEFVDSLINSVQIAVDKVNSFLVSRGEWSVEKTGVPDLSVLKELLARTDALLHTLRQRLDGEAEDRGEAPRSLSSAAILAYHALW